MQTPVYETTTNYILIQRYTTFDQVTPYATLNYVTSVNSLLIYFNYLQILRSTSIYLRNYATLFYIYVNVNDTFTHIIYELIEETSIYNSMNLNQLITMFHILQLWFKTHKTGHDVLSRRISVLRARAQVTCKNEEEPT